VKKNFDHVVFFPESGIPALDEDERRAVEQYKKDKDLKKLKAKAKEFVERTTVNGQPVREYWKGQYKIVKDTIDERKKKAKEEKERKEKEKKEKAAKKNATKKKQ
jgi:CRISPR/Cas system-associated endonuclease Cas1